MSIISKQAQQNIGILKKSDYPGRGIICGLTPSGKELVQIYWTMGRSKSSKNRVMLREGDNVKTLPYDKSLEMQHEELIIYNVSAQVCNAHIVTNGRQTDTINEYLAKGGSFEEALYRWEFENDAPIYTTRISGLAVADGTNSHYKLSLIKALEQNPDLLSHQFFSYKAITPGYGHCIHTYSLSQTCMPFNGEPYWSKVFETVDENANFYWDILPEDKRVALYAKQIDILSGKVIDRILSIHNNNRGKTPVLGGLLIPLTFRE